jgi:hypothetical protein
METVGEPYGFYPKLLKWKHFVPSVPKSLGQQALRKIRSLEHFPAVCPPTRSTAASLKHRRCWAFPARHLGLRIVAIEEIGGPKATTEKPRHALKPRGPSSSSGDLVSALPSQHAALKLNHDRQLHQAVFQEHFVPLSIADGGLKSKWWVTIQRHGK